MKIDNEFTVGVPVERAWEVLTDLEAIAPCMPGAQLTGVEDEVYTGKIKVKVGPVVSQYAGTARFLEKDAVNHRAVIDAKGRDSRGAGNASAAITAHLRADGDHTVVTVNTDLKISGKIAQLGSGMIKEVSTKLLGQFVTCLESKLTTPAPATASTPPTGPTPATGSTSSTGSTPATDPASATGSTPATDPASATNTIGGAAVSATPEDAAALAVADTATTPVAPAESASGASPGTADTASASGAISSDDSAATSGAPDASAGGAGDSAAAVPDATVPGAAVPGAAVPDGTEDAPAGGAAASVSADDVAGLAGAAQDEGAAEPGAAPGAAPATAQGAATRRVIDQDEVEPLDIMSVAGGSVYKRVIPLVVGIVVVIVAVIVVWTLVA